MLNYKLDGYQGVILPELNIGFDIKNEAADYIFISHAHADHLPRDRNMRVFATPATSEFMRIRGFKGDITTLNFGTTIALPNADVTLYPAGHILGSAMIGVQSDEGHILYTGDYRNPASPVTEGFDHPHKVDYLITEATFPLPIYKWKSHDLVFDDIRTFAVESLNDGAIPIFLCYNLGKAQEVMHALFELNLTIQVHGAAKKLCDIYTNYGYKLGSYESYNKDTVQDNKVLITPVSTLEQPMLRNIRNKRLAYVSGWASHEARRTQLGVDKLIVLSDHIDFFELLNFCEKQSPKMVYITHTPNPKVVQQYLQSKGILSVPLNLELFDEEK